MKEIDENKKNLIKIAIYGGFFLIVILLAAISNRTGNNNNTLNNNNNKTQDNTIIEQIKKIDDNYYSSKVHLVMDDDAISLEYQHLNDIEIGVKKYHGESTEYTKYNGQYYKLDENNFTKLPNFIDFDYDKTFMDIINIKKLLELTGEESNYTYNDEKILKINYKVSDVIKIYNEYNNTNIIKYSDGNIILEIHLTNEEISYLIIDITDLYNLINDKTLENIQYKIKIKSEKEEDVNWLIEKFN